MLLGKTERETNFLNADIINVNSKLSNYELQKQAIKCFKLAMLNAKKLWKKTNFLGNIISTRRDPVKFAFSQRLEKVAESWSS